MFKFHTCPKVFEFLLLRGLSLESYNIVAMFSFQDFRQRPRQRPRQAANAPWNGPQGIQLLTSIDVPVNANRLGPKEGLSGHYNDEVSGSLRSAALADVVRLNVLIQAGMG